MLRQMGLCRRFAGLLKAATIPQPELTAPLWMDRNLVASQVATASDDTLAFGDVYQWGRAADGHQA